MFTCVYTNANRHVINSVKCIAYNYIATYIAIHMAITQYILLYSTL